MFRGEYQHSMDAKSRIVLPAKFREELGVKFMLTKNFSLTERCLLAFTMNEWDRQEQILAELPNTQDEVRRFWRFFIGSAVEAEPDTMGRLVIPQKLREYAGMTAEKQEVISLGQLNKVEIWSKENWDDYNTISDENDNNILAKVPLLRL